MDYGGFPAIQPVHSGFEPHRRSHQREYGLRGGGNIYYGFQGSAKSTDSGANWAALGSLLTDVVVTGFAVNPQSPKTVYAAGYTGLFKSTDGGENWTALNIAGLQSPYVFAVVIDPIQPEVLYAAAGGQCLPEQQRGRFLDAHVHRFDELRVLSGDGAIQTGRTLRGHYVRHVRDIESGYYLGARRAGAAEHVSLTFSAISRNFGASFNRNTTSSTTSP